MGRIGKERWMYDKLVWPVLSYGVEIWGSLIGKNGKARGEIYKMGVGVEGERRVTWSKKKQK